MFVTVQGKPIPVEWQLEAIAHICKVYGIDTKSGCSLQILKNRFRQNKWCTRSRKYVRGTTRPTAVCIRNLPPSFHQLHVVTLINIVSDFDTSSPYFYVDMYRDSQNNSTGNCLIRFLNSMYVQPFFKDIRGLSALDKNIIVTIDEDNSLSREKDLLNPLYTPGKKIKKKLRQYILQQQSNYSYLNSKYSDSSMMNDRIVNSYDAPPMMNKDKDGVTICEIPQCGGNENQTSADFSLDEPMTTIQGKRVPVKMVYGAIAHICKEFNIEIKHGTISDMKKEFKQKVVGPTAMADLYPPPDLRGSNTRSLYITNLPPSFNEFHVVILIHLLSEFDIGNMNFYIDMYQDAQKRYVGDCLIRFINAKFLGPVFIDMLALRNLNTEISLRLDYDCAITAAKDYVNPLFNPKKKWNKMLRYYILHQVFDYTNCTAFLTGDTVKQTSSNNNAVELKHDDDAIEMIEKRDHDRKDNDNVEIEIKDTDNYNVNEESYSEEEGEWVEENKLARIIKASMQIPKSVPATEHLDNTQKAHGRNEDLTDQTDVLFYEDRTSEIDRNNAGKASDCGAMFYEDKTGDTDTINAKSPVQYNVTASQSIDDHTIVSITTSSNATEIKKRRCILALIHQVNKKLQFDMHTVTEGKKSTGEYLLRFRTAEDAIKVFNSLKGVKIKKKDTTVRLFSSKKVKFPETAGNALYPAKNRMLSKTKLYSRFIDAIIRKNQSAERKLISGVNAASAVSRKERPTGVLPTRYTVKQTRSNNNAVKLKHDDDAIEMIEKRDHDRKDKDNVAIEIDKASMQISKSVPATEHLDNTQKAHGRNEDLTDKTDVLFYEDRTSEIDRNNAGKASDCGAMFYEDKTGDTDTVNAKSPVLYNVTASQSIDDRTIVSITTSSEAADDIKRKCILELIRKENKKIKFDMHMVTEGNESTGEYLLRFRTAEDAIKVLNSLKGAKIKNKGIEVRLFSSQRIRFPETAKNTSYPASNKKLLKKKLFFRFVNAVNRKKQAKRKLISGVNAASAASRKGQPADVLPTGTYYDYSLTQMPPEERSYDTYGLNEEFLKKHNINVPLRATVVVKNLNSAVDENKLREVFSLAGVIRRLTNINSDAEGHFAKIEFDHPMEAVQAISLFHHQELYKQKITVQMDTVWEERPLPVGLCSVGRGFGEHGGPLRGVRNLIQLNEAKEALVVSGKFTKHAATDRTMPFMYTYIQRDPPEIQDNTNNSDENISIANASDSASNGDSNASKDQMPNDDIFEGTSIEELTNALTSQGLIPEGANCKDLDDLLNVLKSNPPKKQTEQINVPSEDLDQNRDDNMETAPPNQAKNNRLLNFDSNMSYSTNSPLNPNVMGRFIPNQVNLHSQMLNQRILMSPPIFPPFFPPNMALNFGFQPYMRGPHTNYFHPNMPNMMHHVPQMNQNPVFIPRVPPMNQNPVFIPRVPPMNQNPVVRPRVPPMNQNPVVRPRVPPMNQNPVVIPRVINEIQRAAMLYEDRPQPKRNCDPNITQCPSPNAQNTSQQVQNTQPKQSSKGMKQRYFGRDIPEDCVPLRPGCQSSDATNELSEDVIHLRSPKRRAQQETGDNPKRLQLESPKDLDPSHVSGGAENKTDTLIFKNLPSCVPAEALVSKLSEVGELLFCSLTGKGRAVVRFKDPADAERCTQLFNGSKVEGQVIGVTPV